MRPIVLSAVALTALLVACQQLGLGGSEEEGQQAPTKQQLQAAAEQKADQAEQLAANKQAKAEAALEAEEKKIVATAEQLEADADQKVAQAEQLAADKQAKAEAALEAEQQKIVATAEQAAGFYGLETTTLDGQPAPLAAYAGKVSLVVNVASHCGYTRQYEGLQKLAQDHADDGLVVMGFPCNQFGGQEPGSASEIAQFCSSNYGVTFPMFAKCQVKGPEQSPVYAFLQEQTGEVPQWNFTKYLVGPNGSVLAVFPSNVEPDSDQLALALTKALAAL